MLPLTEVNKSIVTIEIKRIFTILALLYTFKKTLYDGNMIAKYLRRETKYFCYSKIFI